MPLPSGPFDLIYADPPWTFRVWSKDTGQGRSAESHYPTMSAAAIAELPVQEIVAPDAVLLMWATMPTLPEAFDLVRTWGFTYKTVAFTWVKMNSNNDPFMGLGYYTRSNAELCLLATRGKGLRRLDKGVPSVILSRRREHSRKPDGAYDYIDRLFGRDVRRIELFARQAWPGWTAWGYDAPDTALIGLPLEMSYAEA
jgi:N6-adenosine-specific RNA methylase IME4